MGPARIRAMAGPGDQVEDMRRQRKGPRTGQCAEPICSSNLTGLTPRLATGELGTVPIRPGRVWSCSRGTGSYAIRLRTIKSKRPGVEQFW